MGVDTPGDILKNETITGNSMKTKKRTPHGCFSYTHESGSWASRGENPGPCKKWINRQDARSVLRCASGRELVHSHPLRPYPRGLGTVVWVGDFPEPGVVQRLLSRDAPSRVVDEYPGEKVEELLREGIVARDDVLK
jgi:hypothetical protein